MTQQPAPTALGELGAALRALRDRTGKTGAEFAVLLGDGWRQSRVSKIETGRQLPSEADIQAWVSAAGADAAELMELRARAVAEYRSREDLYRRAGGVVAHQADLTELSESATWLAEFQPALVPGLLQTAAYAWQTVRGDSDTWDDGDPPDTFRRIIAARMRRQAMLYEPGREFVYVMTEAALHLRFGEATADTMRGQAMHLADSALLPGVTVAVLPYTTPCPVMPSGFAIYDRELVRIETSGGVLQLTDTEAVARYSRWLDQLVDVALTGEQAAEFCRKVAASIAD